jgi:hypothetical protein
MSHLIQAEVIGLAGKTQPTQINFDRHVNIIFGLNGSGKTSLLKILHSAMAGDGKLLSNVPFTQATVRIHSKKYGSEFTRRIIKSEVSQNRRVDPDASSEIGEEDGLHPTADALRLSQASLVWTETPARPDSHNTNWRHRYLPTSRLHVGQSSAGAGRRLTEERLDEYFATSITAVWSKYNSNVLRAVRDAQEEGLADILRAVLAGSGSTTSPKKNPDLERAYESVRRFLQRQGSPSALGTLDQFRQRFSQDKVSAERRSRHS